MKRWIAALALLAAGCGGSPRAPERGEADPADRGHALYLDGKLDLAERELAAVVERNPKNTFARRILGRILLLKGRHEDSARQFLSYVKLAEDKKTPPDGSALQDLFWAFYRMDNYSRASEAAGLLRDTVFAVKYAEMARRGPPYTCEWTEASCVLGLEGTGVGSLKVNRTPGRFSIDLGAGEIVLDRDFAKAARVRIAGVPSPGFEKDEQGIVEALDLPGLQVRNVPVVVSGTKLGVDGILGVGFLSHVQATLDPRRGRIVLRPAASRNREGEAWPLFFAGDRTLLAPARIDGIETFVIVNPTARGVRFVPSQAMLIEKARKFPQSPALERVEAGSMALKVESQEPEKFPAGLDVAYGFMIGGMIGADAFRNRAVTFDFKLMRITVE